jgi:hypothetical protein
MALIDKIRSVPCEIMVRHEIIVTVPEEQSSDAIVLCLWDPSDHTKREEVSRALAEYLPELQFEFAQVRAAAGFEPRLWLDQTLDKIYGKESKQLASTREERCSFCGLGASVVRKLIAGGGPLPPSTRRPESLDLPRVHICDECIALCSEIVGGSGTENGGPRRAD